LADKINMTVGPGIPAEFVDGTIEGEILKGVLGFAMSKSKGKTFYNFHRIGKSAEFDVSKIEIPQDVGRKLAVDVKSSPLWRAVGPALDDMSATGVLDIDQISTSGPHDPPEFDVLRVFQSLIQRFERSLPHVQVSYAITSSGNKHGGFSGGAQFITASEIVGIDTGDWLARQIEDANEKRKNVDVLWVNQGRHDADGMVLELPHSNWQSIMGEVDRDYLEIYYDIDYDDPDDEGDFKISRRGANGSYGEDVGPFKSSADAKRAGIKIYRAEAAKQDESLLSSMGLQSEDWTLEWDTTPYAASRHDPELLISYEPGPSPNWVLTAGADEISRAEMPQELQEEALARITVAKMG
jgi:hypothetical protein